jgi:DNA-directed RNA polymerase sigma subunit (sigma70/sigma32)
MQSDTSLKSYLLQIGRYPLLRPEQEIELSRKISTMLELAKLEAEGKEVTPEQRRTIKRGIRAKQKFIESNLRLVVGIAKKYQANRRTLELLDLIQVGNIGLCKAVDKFNPERGYKFSTYSFWWITQEIQRSVKWDDPIIRLPVPIHNKLIEVSKTQQSLTQALGRKPTTAEIAEHLNIDLEALTKLVHRAQYVGSLDEPIPGGEGGGCLGDLIADPAAMTADEHLDWLGDQYAIGRLDGFLSDQVDPRARQVLLSRHGDTVQPWSEIEERTGLSRTTLQAIETRARSRLRRLMDGLPVAAAATSATAQGGQQVSLFDML